MTIQPQSELRDLRNVGPGAAAPSLVHELKEGGETIACQRGGDHPRAV